ncbi:hypothetical protein HYH03_012078 [Edaphochlamys debaryana]|uniref:phytol kinase n=1 Tax=Edaphochlamys debaryana TaxID=47281 RepID=A0A835XTL5_9CHLO|nr:hypothetical protein HYH03_012078 [Edaphochlamys debaryana]|eukprot:KAG2489442.1 hypothetical protein HYH03_012078 [Edaphochlamys debaryana]
MPRARGRPRQDIASGPSGASSSSAASIPCFKAVDELRRRLPTWVKRMLQQPAADGTLPPVLDASELEEVLEKLTAATTQLQGPTGLAVAERVFAHEHTRVAILQLMAVALRVPMPDGGPQPPEVQLRWRLGLEVGALVFALFTVVRDAPSGFVLAEGLVKTQALHACARQMAAAVDSLLGSAGPPSQACRNTAIKALTLGLSLAGCVATAFQRHGLDPSGPLMDSAVLEHGARLLLLLQLTPTGAGARPRGLGNEVASELGVASELALAAASSEFAIAISAGGAARQIWAGPCAQHAAMVVGLAALRELEGGEEHGGAGEQPCPCLGLELRHVGLAQPLSLLVIALSPERILSWPRPITAARVLLRVGLAVAGTGGQVRVAAAAAGAGGGRGRGPVPPPALSEVERDRTPAAALQAAVGHLPKGRQLSHGPWSVVTDRAIASLRRELKADIAQTERFSELIVETAPKEERGRLLLREVSDEMADRLRSGDLSRLGFSGRTELQATVQRSWKGEGGWNVVVGVTAAQRAEFRRRAKEVRVVSGVVVTPYLNALGRALRKERKPIFDELQAKGLAPRWFKGADILFHAWRLAAMVLRREMPGGGVRQVARAHTAVAMRVLLLDSTADLWDDDAGHARCPSEPPASLAAALAGGALPALEGVLRSCARDAPGGVAGDAAVLLPNCWGRAVPLLVYGDPLQAGAFVATATKLLRRTQPRALLTAHPEPAESGAGLHAVTQLLAVVRQSTDPDGIAPPALARLAPVLSLALGEWVPELERLVRQAALEDEAAWQQGQRRARQQLGTAGMGTGSSSAARQGEGEEVPWLLYRALTELLATYTTAAAGRKGAPPEGLLAGEAAAGGSGSELSFPSAAGLAAPGLVGVALGLVQRRRPDGGAWKTLYITIAFQALYVAETRADEVRALHADASAFAWRPEAVRLVMQVLGDDKGAWDRIGKGLATLERALEAWAAGREGSGQLCRLASGAMTLGLYGGLLCDLGGLMVPLEEARRRLGLPPACSNPACANLAGDSEAGLRLQRCGRCGRVSYCCQECQRAHWRSGHKEACGGGGGSGA